MLNAAEFYRIRIFEKCEYIWMLLNIFDYIMWLMLNAAEFYRIRIFEKCEYFWMLLKFLITLCD